MCCITSWAQSPSHPRITPPSSVRPCHLSSKAAPSWNSPLPLLGRKLAQKLLAASTEDNPETAQTLSFGRINSSNALHSTESAPNVRINSTYCMSDESKYGFETRPSKLPSIKVLIILLLYHHSHYHYDFCYYDFIGKVSKHCAHEGILILSHLLIAPVITVPCPHIE